MFRSYREGKGMNITSLILNISFFLAVLQLYLSVQNFMGGWVVPEDIRDLILNKGVIPRYGQEVGGLVCCHMRSTN